MLNILEELTIYLHDEQLVLATAESCTAGLVASILGEVAGSGEWLDCGFVTYSVESKNHLLGVSLDTISRYGLTSEQVAAEMAIGALKNSKANVAISNTGVAGPNHGDDGTPAGTICFGWAFHYGDSIDTYTERLLFKRDRNGVRKAAAEYGLIRISHYHQLSKKERANGIDSSMNESLTL
jgi:PncC family amidohydrolase